MSLSQFIFLPSPAWKPKLFSSAELSSTISSHLHIDQPTFAWGPATVLKAKMLSNLFPHSRHIYFASLCAFNLTFLPRTALSPPIDWVRLAMLTGVYFLWTLNSLSEQWAFFFWKVNTRVPRMFLFHSRENAPVYYSIRTFLPPEYLFPHSISLGLSTLPSCRYISVIQFSFQACLQLFTRLLCQWPERAVLTRWKLWMFLLDYKIAIDEPDQLGGKNVSKIIYIAIKATLREKQFRANNPWSLLKLKSVRLTTPLSTCDDNCV